MKRDLKINYGILDDIINQLGIYKRSLSDIESSLSTITTYIEQNHGQSIEAWKDRMKGSREQMAEYETQINDLLNLFQGYVDDTTAYITPLQRNTMMRVDRNDIYWNLKQMESGIYNNVPEAISRTYKTPSFWGFWEDVTDAEKNTSSINKSKIANIRSDIEQTNSRLNHKMDQLWDLYNSKVKKYENMDDEYNDKAAAWKKKYTNYFEGLWDLAEGTGKFVVDLVVGLLKGLFIDIGWGLIKLVYNIGVVAVSIQISDRIEPKFLKDAADERIDSFYTMVQQIVEDPFSVVEGMGQSISDSVEEDGIVYVTGGVAAGFVPIVGWSKYAKVGKVVDANQPKKLVKEIEESNSNIDANKMHNNYNTDNLDGIDVIDGKVGGKIPVEDFVEIRQKSIKNPDADSITLGKYTPTIENGFENWGKAGPDSYIGRAGNDSTYFDLGSEWGVIQKKYDLTDDEMFEYFNVPALDDAVRSGKEIRFSHNPELPKYQDSYLAQEWLYLKEKYGFDEVILKGDVWIGE